jgi:hypothetical protein
MKNEWYDAFLEFSLEIDGPVVVGNNGGCCVYSEHEKMM